jgi:hypothetical protein
VDGWGVAHDVPNLVVVDGSVFVTAGAANPTSTITALALRAAEHLVEHRADVPVPGHTRSTSGFAATTPPAVAAPAPAAIVARRPTLTDAMRRRLTELADQLIPAGDGMPAASDVAVAGALVDAVLAARPDLEAGLRRALDGGDDIASGPTPAATDPDDRRTLQYVVAAAYYLDPGVRTRLGYEPEPPTPVRALDFPEYLAEGLLDHLIDA